MGYYDNPNDKKIIDCVLRQNAMMFANLGADSSPADYEKAKVQERQKLRRIVDRDPDLINRLIKISLDD